MGFSVNVLVFDGYGDLASRCLGSILPSCDHRKSGGRLEELRIGMNTPSPQLASYVDGAVRDLPVPCITYQTTRNVGKYPLMRVMWRQPALTAANLMWFDDDSYLHEAVDASWWLRHDDILTESHMFGAKWYVFFRPGQADYVRKQPWCTKPIPPRHRVDFATGGWWGLRTEIVKKWDWPPVTLHHNGGDSMLGELCRHQDYKIHNLNKHPFGVTINTGPRRKELLTPWVGEKKPSPAGLVPMGFSVVRTSYRPGQAPLVEAIWS